MLAVIVVTTDLILYTHIIWEQNKKEGKDKPNQYFKRKYSDKLLHPITKQ